MPAEPTTAPWWRRIDPGVGLWLLAAAVVWGVRGFQGDLGRDQALYVYAGQAVADGAPPYVEVMNRSGPLAALLPGAGIALGRLVGLDDVVAARVLFLVLLVLTPPLVYVLARDVFSSRLAGSTAAATLLAFPGLALSATDGPQSKQAMLVLLVVALLLLTRRRWLWAGVATGLATLAWQPVVIVLVVVASVLALLSSGDLRRRLTGLVRFVAGGALTLGVTVAYFFATGSLTPFVEGYWGINARYTEQQGLAARPVDGWNYVTEWFGWTVALLFAGLLLSVALGLRAAIRRSGRDADVAALGAGTLAGVGWSMIAFNGAPDSLVVLPMAAIGLGGGVALAGELLPERWQRPLGVVVVGWVVLALVATLHLTWTSREQLLAAERADAEAVFEGQPDDATVFVFYAPQPLALTGRKSISRFVLFGEGMKDYVASQWDDGFDGFVAWVREEQPDVIIVTERGLVGKLRPLSRDYVELGGTDGYRAYVPADETPQR